MEIIHLQEKLIFVSAGNNNKARMSDDTSGMAEIIAFGSLGFFGANLFQKNVLVGAALGAGVGYGLTKLPPIISTMGDAISGIVFSPINIFQK